MDDVKDTPIDTPAAPPPAPRRRWRNVLLYLLAAIGLLALALVALGWYAHSHTGKAAPRVAIDEAAVIDSVMDSTYGKYSATKKGWLYVGDDNLTYLMRVVQHTRILDGADGDELYFTASGVAVDGSDNARYGVFYIHPARPYDGSLKQTYTQVKYSSTQAVRPEQVRFEALSDTLWGWVIKAQYGSDPRMETVTTTNTVLAPHGDEIATLGEFLAARDAAPADPCDVAKAAWDTVSKEMSNGASKEGSIEGSKEAPPDDDGEVVDGPDVPLRCDKRRWTYRTDTVNGSIPVPFTVTAGGTQDGRPVEAHTWKLVFDTKHFSYNIPAELSNVGGEE